MVFKNDKIKPLASDAMVFVICAEKYYLKVSSCLIHSIIAAHAHVRGLDIILITPAKDKEIIEKLSREFGSISGVRFNIIEFDQIDFEGFHAPIHFSSAMYLRLLIPEILANYEKIIYIDADVIVCEDISSLFDIDLRGLGCVCAAAWDEALSVYAKSNEKIIVGEEYLSIRFYFDRVLGVSLNNYVNSGVMCLDLTALRKMKFANKAIELAKNNFAFPDQDIVNILLKDNIYILNKEFNFMPSSQISAGNDILNYKPKILHFSGPRKPWHDKNLPFSEYFWIHAARSVFYRDFENDADRFRLMGEISLFDKWRLTRIIRKLCRGDKFYWEHLRLFVERCFQKSSARRD